MARVRPPAEPAAGRPVASSAVPTASHDFRRTRARRLLAAVALTTTVVGMASCSTPAPKQQQLSDALVDSGFSRKVSDCAAKALTTSLSSSELSELAERGAGGVPVDDPKKANENVDKLTQAMATCRDLQVASAPTTTTAPPEPEGGASTTTIVAPGTDGARLDPASTTTSTP